jgi:hypothetical protein
LKKNGSIKTLEAFSFFTAVLQAYQDHPQLNSTQFFDLVAHIYQILNETIEGGEKFDDLLKYIDNFQPQVSITNKKLHSSIDFF